MAQEKRTLVDEVLDDVLQVRETALANAKLALEEAFEPRIKSMISRHLQSEAELEEAELEEVELEERGDEDMDEMEDEELEERGDKDEMEERSSDDDMEERGMMNAGDEDMEEELEPSDIDDENEEPSDVASDSSDIGEGDHSDDEMEEMSHDDEMEEMHHDDEMEEEDDLDLESVIAELEAELSEEEDEDHMDEEEEMEETVSEEEEEDDDDEIIDLDELLTALTEDDEVEEVVEEEVEEVVEEQSELEQENERLASELKEHREAVEILRTKLNEVNLLNAKLLYTTKLFRKFNLSNDQKMKVVESFDRTSSVRETKLVFSTLAESLGMNNSPKVKKSVSSITEGFASKPTTSTKPKQQEIISEGNAVADRFRRLVSYNK
jgi:hypothetical protein